MATYYAGAGDGYVGENDFGTWKVTTTLAWDTTHDATIADGTSSEASYTFTSFWVLSGFLRGANSSQFIGLINRTFIPIDTSGIDDGATIVSALLYLYQSATASIYNDDNDGDDWINVVGETTQASTTELVIEDLDQCGAIDNPTEGATRIDIGNISADNYNSWTLNATGLTWIKKTVGDPYTMFGLREGHDCIDSKIVPDPESNYHAHQNGTGFNSSEDTSGTKDPYLDVTVQTTTIADYLDANNWVACRVYQRAS